MRYKSPARSSFRDNNKLYATLTTQSTAYSTMSRSAGGGYSDDSAERVLQHSAGSSPHPGHHPYKQQHGPHPQQHTEQLQLHAPSTGVTELPPQTEIPGESYPQNPGAPGERRQPSHRASGERVYGFDPRQPSQYRYNISGQTQDATVIWTWNQKTVLAVICVKCCQSIAPFPCSLPRVYQRNSVVTVFVPPLKWVVSFLPPSAHQKTTVKKGCFEGNLRRLVVQSNWWQFSHCCLPFSWITWLKPLCEVWKKWSLLTPWYCCS